MKHADLSGLIAMKEVMEHAKKQGILIFLVNLNPEMQSHLSKSGIEGDDIAKCSEELQDKILAARAVSGGSAASESLDVESLGMVTDLLKESKTNSLIELAQWSASKDRQTTSRTATGEVGKAVYSLVQATDADHTD